MPHIDLHPSAKPEPSRHAGLGTRRYLELFERLAPLIGNQDEHDICERACGLIAQLLEVGACSLFRAGRGGLQLAAATHIPREVWGQVVVSPREGICGKVFTEGRPMLIRGEEQFKRAFDRQSEKRYASASCIIVPLEVQGRVQGVINVANPVGRRSFRQRDVDLLQAAAGLIGSALATAIQSCEFRLIHRSLEDIFDSLHVGIVSVSAEGRVTHVNQRARTLLGLAMHNGDQPPLGELLPGTVYNVCQRLMRQSGVGDEAPQERIKIDLDGRELLLEITAGQIGCCFGEPEGSGLLMFEDVGQDEEIKRLRESEGMKHNFLSIISHELRTPLTVIRGAVPLIDPKTGRDIGMETLYKVHHLLMRNCQRLNEVINSILDVTEIESGTLRLNVRELNLHELLDEVISMAAENAAHRQLAWDCRFEALQPRIQGDPRRLKQVLHELVSNAIKFSNPGGSLVLRTRQKESWIEVELTNTGARIAPEQRKIIFEKFIQGASAMTRSAGGCGLGLFLVQNLVRLHGGRIELLESQGDETTFVIHMPLGAGVD